MSEAKTFFNNYATEFSEIYGTDNSFINTILNPILRKSMRLRFEKTMMYCQPMHGKTALDIGCGPGHYSVALAKSGADKVVGLDFSSEMIKIAKGKASLAAISDKCHFIVKDVFNHYTAEKFNYSIIMGVMDYISDPEKMIDHVFSLTQEMAFFSFPASGGLLAFQRRVRYRKRCPLFLYDINQLEEIFNKTSVRHYSIEKISRDYFVSVKI